jgi:2-phospho-L-lactate guanylyltransferase
VKTAAFVPFKCFTRAKRRLRTAFSDAAVEEIGRAMLLDVLEALVGAQSLSRVAVLTDDTAVAQVAEQARAEVRLRTPDPGLNPAIEDACAEAGQQGFDAALVVLGDLPQLRSEDVEIVLEAGAHAPVVIVPSQDGGTALLYRRPPQIVPAHFGPDSAAAHANAAREAGIEPVLLHSLDALSRLDLDTPEDVEKLLASDRGSRTREVLEKLTG